MTTETEVANVAIQHCGGILIAGGLLRTEDSENAAAIRACYDIMRRSELRRNVWRFSIRNAILRAFGNDSKIITFPAWSTLVQYALNDVVLREGKLWIATAANIALDPALRTETTFAGWTSYFGVDMANAYATTLTYMTGEMVYSGVDLYISIIDQNADDALSLTTSWQKLTATAYAAGTAYALGARVISASIVYVSIQAANTGNTPVSSPLWWTAITQATLATLAFIYPIGAGPYNNTTSRNVYRLPKGFMRKAEQAPLQGVYALFGAPAGRSYSDWLFEGNYFTAVDSGPIPFRFAADIEDPNLFDPMFIDGYACRLALQVVEKITQATGKAQTIGAMYQEFMSNARTVNGIETGSVEPPEDTYLTVRY